MNRMADPTNLPIREQYKLMLLYTAFIAFAEVIYFEQAPAFTAACITIIASVWAVTHFGEDKDV